MTTTPFPFQDNQTLAIEQATTIDKDLLLCRVEEEKLLLLNIKTGSHSYIHEGITHLPGITSNSSRGFIKVSHMADIRQKGYLLALGPDQELIQFKYDGKFTNYKI